MKCLKYLFVLILLAQYTSIDAQRGCKVLMKAEKQYQKGNYGKVLKLLDKADNMGYATCRNYYINANRKRIWIKASTYIKIKEYQLARNTIDSTFFGYVFDSLYMVSYQKEYGSEFLKEQTKKAISNGSIKTEMICRNCGKSYKNTCIAYITLENEEVIKISFPFTNSEIIEFLFEEAEIKMMIEEALLNSQNYQLLTEKLN